MARAKRPARLTAKGIELQSTDAAVKAVAMAALRQKFGKKDASEAGRQGGDPVRFGYMSAIQSIGAALSGESFGSASAGKKALSAKIPLAGKTVRITPYVAWAPLAKQTLKGKRRHPGAGRFWIDQPPRNEAEGAAPDKYLFEEYAREAGNRAIDIARGTSVKTTLLRPSKTTMQITVAYGLQELPDPLNELVRRAFILGDQKAAEAIRTNGTIGRNPGIELLGLLEYGSARRKFKARSPLDAKERKKRGFSPLSRRRQTSLPPRPFVRQLSARIGQDVPSALKKSLAAALTEAFGETRRKKSV